MKRLIIFIAVMVLILSSCVVIEDTCPEPQMTTNATQDTTTYELFDSNALTLIDKKQITSNQVSVDGVFLGDSFQEVVEKIGPPQVIDEFYEDDIVNAKYETEDGQTTYIFHLENGSVSRIVIRPGLNDRLPKGSRVDMDLATITSRFGKPEYSEDVVLANSGYRVYYYYTLGFEVYHKRKDMIGYAFVTPQEVPEDLVYNEWEGNQ